VLLNLYDVSGKPEYAETRTEILAESQAVLLVFDASSAASFAGLPAFVDELAAAGLLGPRVVRVLCMHKTDLPTRAVAADAARAWASVGGWTLFETSAESGDGIVAVINHVVAALK
jgi:GTPase SAR1 family protein